MSRPPSKAPLHNVKHGGVLHARNMILTVHTEDMPRITNGERVTTERFSDAFSCVSVRFGFMELPDLPRALEDGPR